MLERDWQADWELCRKAEEVIQNCTHNRATRDRLRMAFAIDALRGWPAALEERAQLEARVRELEEENKLLRGSAELGKEDLELLLKECKELKEENSRLQKVLEANGITYNDALIIGRHLDEMGESAKWMK